MKKNDLSLYSKKRNFKETPEPGPHVPKKSSKPKEPVFVIQKHDATRLHYDFRLEVDGVLKSWAVPKGPSLNPKDKRLAMPTEDHPMNYAQFEGIIPEGNYGAGPVIVWDYGTFVNLSHDAKTKKLISVRAGLKRGQIMFWLKGKKIQGSFVLTKIKGQEAEKKTPWLLIKVQDKAANKKKNIVASENKSVFSGLTIEEMAGNRKAKKWKSNRAS